MIPLLIPGADITPAPTTTVGDTAPSRGSTEAGMASTAGGRRSMVVDMQGNKVAASAAPTQQRASAGKYPLLNRTY